MNKVSVSDALEHLVMTQADLAAALNVTQSAVSQWASGRRSMPSSVESKLRDAVAASWAAVVDLGVDSRRRTITAPAGPWKPLFTPRERFRLPLRLNWSGGPESRWLDPRDPDDVVYAWALVIDEGSAADAIRWLDPELLAKFWPLIPVSRSRKGVWEEHLRKLGYEVTNRAAI